MNLSALTTSLMLGACMLFSGCSINGIANSNVSIEGNEAQATVKKTIKINNFEGIEASQAIRIIYVQGSSKGIAEISTTPSAEKYLKVEVKNNKLKAYYSNSEGGRNIKIKGPTTIKVTSPQLNEVDLSSAANLSIEGVLQVKGSFEVDLSSASSLDAGEVRCNVLDADLSSSASMNIGKLTGNLDAELSSASSLKMKGMKGNVDAESSSAASITINSIQASDIKAEASSASSISISNISGGSVNASASSGAKINLSGKAEQLNKNASSGGTVNHSDLKVR